MRRIGIIALLSLMAGPNASAKCPDWITGRVDVPKCPPSSSAILPDNYPVSGVVVSDAGPYGPGFAASFVESVLLSAGKRTPIVALPVSDKTFELVRERVAAAARSVEEKKSWLQALVQVKDVESMPWQQDYFESFVNASGSPVLRPVANYPYETPLSPLVKAFEECGVSHGMKLESPTGPYDFVNGMGGGNIEGLPGGLCLLGTDYFQSGELQKKYARQFCTRMVSVPTSWLKVGHSDEIVKVVRKPGAKAPCDFAIAIASPDKAIELLKKNPNRPFLDFPGQTEEAKAQLNQKRSNFVGIRDVCMSIPVIPEQSPQEEDQKSESRGASFKFNQIQLGVLPQAEAEATLVDVPTGANCSKLTNQNVLDSLKGPLGPYNRLIQDEMRKFQQDLESALKSSLPQCNVEMVEVPSLFFGGNAIEEDGSPNMLPRSAGLSVLPNPTNSVMIENTLIMPEPGNSQFKDYMAERFKALGLETRFVDTFDYVHRLEGNLHCATHTLPICKPNKDVK